jgi:hypothetical protein
VDYKERKYAFKKKELFIGENLNTWSTLTNTVTKMVATQLYSVIRESHLQFDVSITKGLQVNLKYNHFEKATESLINEKISMVRCAYTKLKLSNVIIVY